MYVCILSQEEQINLLKHTFQHSMGSCLKLLMYMHFNNISTNPHEQEFSSCSQYSLTWCMDRSLRSHIAIWFWPFLFLQTLPPTFCNAIGLSEACTITLKTSLSSTRSWQVHVLPYKHASNLGSGWKRFCWDNDIKEGDTYTFNIVETTLWHVVIVHR